MVKYACKMLPMVVAEKSKFGARVHQFRDSAGSDLFSRIIIIIC